MKRVADIFIGPWSPGVQAESEQNHAKAVDNLRGADVFFVVTGKVRDGERVETQVISGGAAHDVIFRHVLLAASNEAVRFWEALDGHTGEEETA